MPKLLRDRMLVENKIPERKVSRGSRTTVQTTLGDLIVALVEEVEPYVATKAEVNVLVGYILTDLCRHNRQSLNRNTADPAVMAASH